VTQEFQVTKGCLLLVLQKPQKFDFQPKKGVLDLWPRQLIAESVAMRVTPKQILIETESKHTVAKRLNATSILRIDDGKLGTVVRLFL
jgi:hypothetical protein